MKPFDRKVFQILSWREVGGDMGFSELDLGPYDMSGYADVSLHVTAFTANEYFGGYTNPHLLVFARSDMDDDSGYGFLVEDVEIPLAQMPNVVSSISLGIDPLPSIMGILLVSTIPDDFEDGVICNVSVSAQCLSDSAIPLNPYMPPCW